MNRLSSLDSQTNGAMACKLCVHVSLLRKMDHFDASSHCSGCRAVLSPGEHGGKWCCGVRNDVPQKQKLVYRSQWICSAKLPLLLLHQQRDDDHNKRWIRQAKSTR